MPLTDYHKSILRLRTFPLKRTREIEERLDTSLRMAWAQLDEIIYQSRKGGILNRRLFEARRANITALINELAISLKRDLMNATQDVAQQVAFTRQDATNQLLLEQGLSLITDFSSVPQQTLEL